MTQDGYIKLWRKSLEDSLWQNISIWRFFEYCLLKATYREHTVLVGMQEIHLEPGQFVFGRKVASEESGLSEQVIRTCLKKLRNMKKLTIKPTNKFTVISIVNWARYQDEENQINQHINQQLTNKQPTTNHIQERKERIRKERIKEYCPEPPKIEGSGLPSENPSILSIPLKGPDGNYPLFHITNAIIEEYKETFPGLDVMQCLRECRQWNKDNPGRRKTKTGIRKHITQWLTKDNNSGKNLIKGDHDDARKRRFLERHEEAGKVV